MQDEVDKIGEKIKEKIPSEEEVNRERVKRQHQLEVLANKKVMLNDTYGRNN